MVTDRVRDCYRPSKGLVRGDIKWVVIHRCSLGHYAPAPIKDADLTAPEMSQRFKDAALGTGGLMPYHGLVLANGSTEQAVPLSRRASHAKGVNWCSLSWAVVGEHGAATSAQMQAVADVAANLIIYCRGNIGMLRGHTEIPGGSADQSKICPGPVVNMDELRDMVAMRLPPDLSEWSMSHADIGLRKAGFVLESQW
jgi:hypothetical protein